MLERSTTFDEAGDNCVDRSSIPADDLNLARILLLRVRRRCLVCDGEDEREEVHTTDEIGPECLQCHAPTERIAVLGRRTVKKQPHPYAAALGRLGGLKGGPARARALSATRRREIARLGARVRWGKRR